MLDFQAKVSGMKQTEEIIRADGFQAEVIRTNRKKSISLKVVDGRVVVRVPKATSARNIAALVARKTRWIHEKLLQQETRRPLLVRHYVSGEGFEYLGDEVVLQVVPGQVKTVTLEGGVLRVQVPLRVRKTEVFVRRALQEWFSTAAQVQLPARIDYFATRVGAAPAAIKVRRYKARWGSCTRGGELAFNWLIMVAPPEIVDYVVVHELCHLRHHNHGREFWQSVARVLPDYDGRRHWLKENGWRLIV